jgi:cytochrome P450
MEWEVPIQDIARFELGGTFAILPNTVYTSFWVIYHMYSDPVVLDDCRRELEQVVQFGSIENTIDIAEVKIKCPILLSTVKEVLRCYNNGTSPRIALEDHMLGNEFLIKKGSTIMIPSAVQHSDKDNWGPTVADFDHKRFVRTSGKPRHNPVAFRGFGGGATLCPGRNFATTEIITFCALMAMRFDVEPVGGEWIRPTTNKAGGHITTPDPDNEIDVKIIPREPNKRWKVMLSGSEKAMELVAEDEK